MDTPFEGLVETTAGPTFVKTVGQGPPMVIVHGGPGFDHGYLTRPLAFLARHRTLIFFDQPGCGRTPPPAEGASAAATFRHFRALLDHLHAESLGVIGHSWGALVAVAAMAEAGVLPPFAEAIFVNPTPIKGAEYAEARSAFLLAVPPDRLGEMQRLVGSGAAGADVFAVLMPYYLGKPATATLPRLDVSPATYFAVDASLASLGAFDFSGGLSAFRRLGLILGERDFVKRNLIAEVIGRADRVITMPGIGHFPSFEAPREFEAAVTTLIN
jgi:pimeloyl-ACP methyl ester carboxylesterase